MAITPRMARKMISRVFMQILLGMTWVRGERVFFTTKVPERE
jgi:hypothetical protein